ncbi:hypothetical protein Pla108_33630 [Botrimarina colliarenosi]|uniref:LssY-like C-terminal domain-containing protein n=1 Tax=Botrimarina colliarenosi TaxID=2528001 RepID=A0A5C6A753_9BACT|nr:LssY C-terminal domain-containing protein [Botrimarina colliarenosi]TWT95220.1 hypothetical protein Pla108_33630 [Botrimarina colliarenosi]
MKRHRIKRRHVPTAVALIALLYLAAAYVIAPLAWERYAERHPTFDDNPRITKTSDGHPGDPLNVALVGEEAALRDLMKAAGWYPATALGLRSDLRIADDTILSRPDDEAPVSNLYLFGRKEDLAFEQPVGDNPRQRHHVRFWKTPDADDRTLWIGSASYDERVGLSATTGQITHHIAGDIDTERDHLFADLKATGRLAKEYPLAGFQTQLEGRNGGGDRWRTDGQLFVGVIEE